MRFKPGPKVEGYQETSRKRAAVLVSQRHQREKLPLFAALIAEKQPSVEDVIAHRHKAWPIAEQKRRNDRAVEWRKARAKLRMIPDTERAALTRKWNRSSFPGDPSYLASLVHSFSTGGYVMHEGEIISTHELKHQRERDAKIVAMTDAELDHAIQTHWSPLIIDLSRAERRRRAEAAAVEAPALRLRRAGPLRR